MAKTVPVHILSGFLGSGKTTLLTQALDYYKQSGKKPAVLMNELGEVNLDGMLVDDEVPMTEMLSGCICCTIRGDLGMELRELIREHTPDVIFVECTGAANPIEVLDGVTDASLLTEMELKSLITVVDTAQLLERHAKGTKGQGKTYRLMQEQIRCASVLILNKTDLISASDLLVLKQAIRDWNPQAPMIATTRCQVDLAMFDWLDGSRETVTQSASDASRMGHESHGSCSDPSDEHNASSDRQRANEHHASHASRDRQRANEHHGSHASRDRQQANEHHASDASHDCQRSQEHDDPHDHHHSEEGCTHPAHYQAHADDRTAHSHHHSHDHVMVYTHYFQRAIDSEQFEALVSKLPAEIYRAKGILRFTDTSSLFLFQYAYREMDFMKITPKEQVPSVAVFIGEHFSKTQLAADLTALEHPISTEN